MVHAGRSKNSYTVRVILLVVSGGVLQKCLISLNIDHLWFKSTLSLVLWSRKEQCCCCCWLVAYTYLPVTGQRQTLTIRRSAQFSLQWLLRDWKNPYLLWSFQWSNAFVDFVEFLHIKLAAWSKLSSRDKLRKASYSTTQQHDQGLGWTHIMQPGSS